MQVDHVRLALERAVGGQAPGEAAIAVALVVGARAETEDRAVGGALERRQDRQRLDVGLVALALIGVVGRLARQHRAQLAWVA